MNISYRKTGFLVRNIHLYLCWQVEDTKWILCCRKTDVKCAYLRFLMYKYTFSYNKIPKKYFNDIGTQLIVRNRLLVNARLCHLPVFFNFS